LQYVFVVNVKAQSPQGQYSGGIIPSDDEI
jgi:hypothetical protein